MTTETTAPANAAMESVGLALVFANSQVSKVLENLDRGLVGLAPVKARIGDTAALLLVDRGTLMTIEAEEIRQSRVFAPANPRV